MSSRTTTPPNPADLERETQERILAQVEDRADVDRLLSYDEETAGGRMTAQVVTAQAGDTLGSALESIRRQAGEQEDFSQFRDRRRGAAAAPSVSRRWW